MITQEVVSQLKQTNISRDTTKTHERLKQIVGASKNAQKKEIDALTGTKRSSLLRAVNTGSASAKIILPVAQILNVSPYWLIGATDNNDTFKFADVKSLLSELGYTKLAETLVTAETDAPSAAKPKRGRKPKVATPVKETEPQKIVEATVESVTPESEVVEPTVTKESEPVLTVKEPTDPAFRKILDGLNEDDSVSLLRALFLRAKVNSDAAKQLEIIKICLFG